MVTLPWIIWVSSHCQHLHLLSPHQSSRAPSLAAWRQSHPQNWCFPLKMAHSSYLLQLPSAVCRHHHPREATQLPRHTQSSPPQAHTPRTHECNFAPLFSRAIQHNSLSLPSTHGLLFPAAPFLYCPIITFPCPGGVSIISLSWSVFSDVTYYDSVWTQVLLTVLFTHLKLVLIMPKKDWVSFFTLFSSQKGPKGEINCREDGRGVQKRPKKMESWERERAQLPGRVRTTGIIWA